MSSTPETITKKQNTEPAKVAKNTRSGSVIPDNEGIQVNDGKTIENSLSDWYGSNVNQNQSVSPNSSSTQLLNSSTQKESSTKALASKEDQQEPLKPKVEQQSRQQSVQGFINKYSNSKSSLAVDGAESNSTAQSSNSQNEKLNDEEKLESKPDKALSSVEPPHGQISDKLSKDSSNQDNTSKVNSSLSAVSDQTAASTSSTKINSGSSGVEISSSATAAHGNSTVAVQKTKLAEKDNPEGELPELEQPIGQEKIKKSPVKAILPDKGKSKKGDPSAKSKGVTFTKPALPKEKAKKAEKVEFLTEDPGQILDKMKGLPPITAHSAYGQAGEASKMALDKQKSKAQKGLPEMQAPTGLSPQMPDSIKKEGVKPSLDEKPVTDFSGEKSGKEGPDYKATVSEIAPPLKFKPTYLFGGDVDKATGNDAELSENAQNEMDSIGLKSELISTSAGERPTVDMTGESDPSQMESFQGESDNDVQKAKLEASQEMYKDFGENDIYPEYKEKRLKSEKVLTGSKSLPHAKGGKALNIPPEAVKGINLSFGPAMADRIGEQKDEYDVGKTQYEADSANAKADADQQIITLNKDTAKQQIDEQNKARSEVVKNKEEWKSELDKVDKDYQEKASKASVEQKQKIETEKQSAEEKSAKHLDEAEKNAQEEKEKKEKEAEAKKAEKKKESKGFWGWVKSAASALIDGLKAAMNFIYDTLRSAVKLIFEAAKFLVKSVIEAARFVITGLIKAYGFILKGLVSIVFAAFPDIAKKINDKIDKAVNFAVDAVNKAAEVLSDAVSAILDFVANLIDSALGLIQSIYNGIFTVLGMIVRGEFGELMERLGCLVDAAKAMPDKFETAAYEELLGGNLDEPLSPQELIQAGKTPPGAMATASGSVGEPGDFPSPPYSTENVGVDKVEKDMELSPELEKELSTVGEDGIKEFGESDEKSRTMEAIKSEVVGSGEVTDQAEQKMPDDGLTPKERAEVKWELMKKGLADWWEKNKVAIIVGAIAAIVGVIALIIVTGGSILAAIPPIMSVLGPLFIGLTVVTIAGHVKDYVSKSWEKDIQGGAKSLAKALAAGAVELITWLTFKAGGVAIKGAKAAAKGGVALAKGTVKLAKGAASLIAKGAKFVIEKGKILFKGIAGSGIAKRLKSLTKFGEELLEKLRFKKFRIRIEGRWFKLEGFINPWVLLATGEIKNVPSSELKGKRVGDVVKIGGEEGIIIGWKGSSKESASRFVKGVKGEADDAAKLFNELSELDKKKLLAKIGKSGKSTYELRKGIPKPHPDFYQAHHIIPEELIGNPKLKGFLDEIGFNFQNGAHNGVLLPPDDALRVKGWMKSTIHRGSHPNYTMKISGEIENLSLEYNKLLKAGTGLDDAKGIINGKLNDLLTNTRNNLLQGLETLN